MARQWVTLMNNKATPLGLSAVASSGCAAGLAALGEVTLVPLDSTCGGAGGRTLVSALSSLLSHC